jgi:RNA recognition motif-containing protein
LKRRGFIRNKPVTLSARLSRKAGIWSEDVKKLYVGNLPFTATEDEISQLFGQHGTVHSVALINDRETGRPRGFGFVEMDDDAIANVIQALDGKELGGRALRVNEAQDRPRTGGGGGGGGGGRGGYGGGGGRGGSGGGGGGRW